MNNLIHFESKHPIDVDEAYHVLNIGNISNVIYWYEFFKLASQVPGCIVECGIGRGRSLIVLSAINKMLEPSEGGGRKIYGFDSFQGFPEPCQFDNSPRNPQKGEWAYSPSGKYEYSPDFIKTVLKNAGCINNPSEITLIKGFFSESLKNYPGDSIALLHIDGDLYQSYRDVLTNLYDFVSPGGIIIFDDFLFDYDINESFPGARKAVNEFCSERKQTLRKSIRGNPYIIKE